MTGHDWTLKGTTNNDYIEREREKPKLRCYRFSGKSLNRKSAVLRDLYASSTRLANASSEAPTMAILSCNNLEAHALPTTIVFQEKFPGSIQLFTAFSTSGSSPRNMTRNLGKNSIIPRRPPSSVGSASCAKHRQTMCRM